MALSRKETRAWVEATAMSRYPAGAEAEHGYESTDQRVFALLVDVAAAYADIIGDDMVGRFAAELDGAPAVRTIGDLLGGPVEVTLQGLRENLELLADGDTHA